MRVTKIREREIKIQSRMIFETCQAKSSKVQYASDTQEAVNWIWLN